MYNLIYISKYHRSSIPNFKFDNYVDLAEYVEEILTRDDKKTVYLFSNGYEPKSEITISHRPYIIRESLKLPIYLDGTAFSRTRFFQEFNAYPDAYLAAITLRKGFSLG